MAKLWGGRYAVKTSAVFERYSNSLASDTRLTPYDLKACTAHVQMLSEVGVINEEDARKLLHTLNEMSVQVENDELTPSGNHEDVHSWVEAELASRVGPIASSIRIGRSRNDLVVTDFRLWMKDELLYQQEAVKRFQQILLTLAERNLEVVMPGYTHLQRAQPVSLAHHLLAYFWMLERDRQRLIQCYRTTDVCPLGAGALAGSTWPIRPERTAELLGFASAFENSLDVVSDRDFAVEFLAAAALCMVHCSRLAEEIILWSTTEFGFMRLSDAWSTGSSLMPQKKNPDPAELVRGRTGSVIGHLMALLTVIKGLPLAYNRDLQDDKPTVFAAADTLGSSLEVLAGAMESAQFQNEKMAAAASDPGLLATDLADLLVRSGVPFAESHELVGRHCEGDTDERVKPLLEQLTTASAVEGRTHRGAAGFKAVAAQLDRARNTLLV
jgi:argininosuccinate lyase